MNFLAHYYFDGKQGVPEYNFGLLLPDLVRNFIPGARLSVQLNGRVDQNTEWIAQGCRQHRKSDEKFHNSTGFREVTAVGNELLKKSSEPMPRYYFLSHVLSELLLDKILLQRMPSLASDLYDDLGQVGKADYSSFLIDNGIHRLTEFEQGYMRFMQIRFLDKYRDFPNIVYALGRIGKKLNFQAFTPYQHDHLLDVSESLESFIEDFLPQLEEILQSDI